MNLEIEAHPFSRSNKRKQQLQPQLNDKIFLTVCKHLLSDRLANVVKIVHL